MTVYLIAPGTRVGISTGGREFKVEILNRQLQFGEPAELTDNHATFDDGKRLIRVDLENVIVSRFDGVGGVHQFGVWPWRLDWAD